VQIVQDGVVLYDADSIPDACREREEQRAAEEESV
jgi:hypothetical protein